ncbi:MAG TPA: type II toxin-antitoxin system prevent-host-death family antitoxin [Candidatus Acidoferrales bacterium]|nr:type II toxin-antitoxin system prevent-host-death family antitoxin [Candidatus Acidoferrales bacterium]
MRSMGLFEAKQKLSELVDRASQGERIGITRRGKLAAVIAPARPDIDVAAVFEKIDEIRKRVRPLKGVTIKKLIEEGRS